MIKMTKNESEKTIPITIKLPSNLPKGAYTHKISARYVPSANYEFQGTAPIAEAFIEINNN